MPTARPRPAIKQRISEATAIEAALEEIRSAGSDPAFFASEGAKDDEDVHSFVERELVQRVGRAISNFDFVLSQSALRQHGQRANQ